MITINEGKVQMMGTTEELVTEIGMLLDALTKVLNEDNEISEGVLIIDLDCLLEFIKTTNKKAKEIL